MKKLIYLIISIVIFVITANADQFETKFSGGLNTTIYDVATGGYWKQNQSYGTWRLVVRNLGWEHTRSFIYLQWLETDDTKKKVIELKTVPIPEFNSSNWHNVMNIEFKNNSFVLYYVVRGKEEITLSATLRPDSPDNYKIIMKKK